MLLKSSIKLSEVVEFNLASGSIWIPERSKTKLIGDLKNKSAMLSSERPTRMKWLKRTFCKAVSMIQHNELSPCLSLLPQVRESESPTGEFTPIEPFNPKSPFKQDSPRCKITLQFTNYENSELLCKEVIEKEIELDRNGFRKVVSARLDIIKEQGLLVFKVNVPELLGRKFDVEEGWRDSLALLKAVEVLSIKGEEVVIQGVSP